MRRAAGIFAAALALAALDSTLLAQEASEEKAPWVLTPFAGPSPAERVAESLHGRVFVGYQGWFTAQGDGIGAGATHWGGVLGDPPTSTVDLWPDLSEYDADERFPTEYRHADGRVAEVFSSAHPKTVDRHFRWMAEHDIDGAFLQRFTASISPDEPARPQDRKVNAVLQHVRAAANRHGRAFALMYDTDFDAARVDRVIADWRRLREEAGILSTNAYLHHAGGPLVAFWGFGFGHRAFDARAAERLLAFFTAPENGGCRILLGVPNDWTSWTDERRDLLERYADVVSPWNVGRYDSAATADVHFERHWPGDRARCEALGADYLPVVFPGFSWTNLKRGEAPLDQIPRRQGAFYWHQLQRVSDHALDMAYVAMFDEVDEGTAIFKVTNDPPVGDFVTYEGLPSDHYLELTRQGRRLIRGQPVVLPPPLDTLPVHVQRSAHEYKRVGDVGLRLHRWSRPAAGSSAPRPAIVFFFGGGWNGGRIEQFQPHCERLAAAGFVAFSAEYRVRSRDGTTPFECVADGKSAVRWIRAHAEELGVDPARIYAGGGSAGGHVAACTALIEGLDEPGEDLTVSSRPDKLVLFNPVIDTGPAGFGHARLGDRWREISPAHHVRAGLPPTLIFHGTADTVVDYDLVESFRDAMVAAGNPCTLLGFEGAKHGFFNADRGNGNVYEGTLVQLRAFLSQDP